MIAELGVYALCWALIFALLLACVPTLGFWLHKPKLLEVVDSYVIAQSVCVAVAYSCLSICFLKDDFSVVYVLANSSVALPWFYKLCAVWGGHEGSMLLWIAILTGWMLAVSRTSRHLE